MNNTSLDQFHNSHLQPLLLTRIHLAALNLLKYKILRGFTTANFLSYKEPLQAFGSKLNVAK